jgi:hypothetical protein
LIVEPGEKKPNVRGDRETASSARPSTADVERILGTRANGAPRETLEMPEDPERARTELAVKVSKLVEAAIAERKTKAEEADPPSPPPHPLACDLDPPRSRRRPYPAPAAPTESFSDEPLDLVGDVPSAEDPDARLFAADDATLTAHLVPSIDAFDLGRWLAATEDPIAITFARRLVELAKRDGAGAGIERFLKAPMPSRFVTEETVPQILALAKEAGVPWERLRIERDGTSIPLHRHPVLAVNAPASLEKRIERMQSLLARLDPASGARPKKRMETLVQLFDADDREKTFEVDELIEGAVAFRTVGRLAPVRVDDDRAEEILGETIGKLKQVGAALLLAALLVDASDAAIADALRWVADAGDADGRIDLWIDVLHQVRALQPGEIEFVFRDIIASKGALFETFLLRLRIAFEPRTPQALAASFEAFGRSDPASFVRVLVEISEMAPKNGETERAVLDFLASRMADGAIDPERHVLAAVVGPRTAWLKERALRQSFLAAQPSDGGAAKTPKVLALEALESLAAETSVASGEEKDLRWLEDALKDAKAGDWSGERLAGLAEAFRRGLVTSKALIEARSRVSPELVASMISKVRSAEARAILERKPFDRSTVLRLSKHTPITVRMSEPTSRTSITKNAHAPNAERIDVGRL